MTRLETCVNTQDTERGEAVSYATLYAKAISNKESLKLAYNNLLLTTREMEAFLDDETIPVEEREALVYEYKALVGSLGNLLKQIGAYTEQDVDTGFSLNSVSTK